MRTRATFALVLTVAMLAAAGCGGSAKSAGSKQASATEAIATTPVPRRPAANPAGGEAKPNPKSSAAHHAKASGKRSAPKTALPANAIQAVTGSAPARAKGSAPSAAASKPGSGKTRNGGGGQNASGPADHGGKKKSGQKGATAAVPAPPPPPNAPLPPGTSVYDLARKMCGDSRNLQFLSPEQQKDPEGVASMAEAFAPPGKEQEAHDGCLAGLQSQGL